MNALPESRSDEGTARTRLLVRGIGSSVLSRAATSLAPLVLIPLTIRYLGAEQYGVWMAITAVTSMFTWADLGLGNSLLTRLTPLVTREAWTEARVVTSAAYGVLCGVAALGVAAALVSYWVVPWAQLVNATPDSSVSAIAVICLVALSVNVPAALVHRVLFALQRVPRSNLIQVMGAAASLLFAAVAVQVQVSPICLIGGIVGLPVLTNFIATLWAFSSEARLRPTFTVAGEEAYALLRMGGKFLAIGIIGPLALNADGLIVAHVDSVSAVAEYSVVSRTFGALGLLVTVVNLPLWPANADAVARGDWEWVGRTTRRMAFLSSVATLGCGLILWTLNAPLFALLGGEDVDPPDPLVLGFAALWTLVALAAPYFMVQNAVGRLRLQLVGWSVFLVVSVALKTLVGARFSVAWIPLTGAVVYLVTVLPSAWVGYRRCVGLARPSNTDLGEALSR